LVFFDVEEKDLCLIPKDIAKQFEKILGITPGIKAFLKQSGTFVRAECSGKKLPVFSKFVYEVTSPRLKEVR
jgi:hypothetical protein